MSKRQDTVFISYRRSVSAYQARAVYQDLRSHGWDVFMDVENLDSGKFEDIIMNQIAARAHFVVLLSPGAVERFTSADDFMRREIEHAMELKRNVIPLLLNGFEFNRNVARKYLKGKLADLPRYNALTITHEQFEPAMTRLRDQFLQLRVTAPLHPTPPQDVLMVQHKMLAADKQPRPTPEQLTAENYFESAVLAWENKDYLRAITDYSHAIELNPNFPQALHNRGIASFYNGDYAGAIEDYTRALDLDARYVDAYFNRGNAYFQRADYIAAIADYSQALVLQSGHVEAFYNRGAAHYALKDYENAIADYSNAIALNPQYTNAYNNRGNTFYQMGEFARAIADYDMAIGLSPGYADVYNNRGAAKKKMGDVVGALADFSEAIRLSPDVPDAFYNRARIYKRREQFIEAITDYQRFLELGGGGTYGNQDRVEGWIVEMRKKLDPRFH